MEEEEEVLRIMEDIQAAHTTMDSPHIIMAEGEVATITGHHTLMDPITTMIHTGKMVPSSAHMIMFMEVTRSTRNSIRIMRRRH